MDDDPEMLAFMAMLMKGNTPYEVMATSNPLEAIELVKNADIDLVITEINMPVVDGHELLEAVRAMDEDTPVIIVSDYGTADFALEATCNGAFDLLMKPFRKEHLLFSVEKALSWAALLKENRMLRKQLEAHSVLKDA